MQSTADEAVIRSFKEAAQIDRAMRRAIESQVENKLLALYARASEPDALSAAVKAALRRHTGDLTSQQREQRVLPNVGEGNVDWRLWLGIYRRCLDDLVPQFGNPGHIFLEKSMAEMLVDGDSHPRGCDC